MNYPTPELLREIAKGMQADVRETCLVAADHLEQRGFYASGRLLLVTEAKALEVELRGIEHAAEKPEIPGWRCYFEGKVRVNDAGTDLEPVTAMESTANTYATHRAAVTDGVAMMKRAGLKAKRTTKAQRQQPVYILPSYLGVATDRYGNVIGESCA